MIAFSLLLAAASVGPAEAEPAPPPAAEEKLICRTNVVTGSRLRKQKVCLTKDGWKRAQDGAARDFDDSRRAALRDKLGGP